MSWLTAVFLVAAGTIATLLGLALTAVIALLVRGPWCVRTRSWLAWWARPDSPIRADPVALWAGMAPKRHQFPRQELGLQPPADLFQRHAGDVRRGRYSMLHLRLH